MFLIGSENSELSKYVGIGLMCFGAGLGMYFLQKGYSYVINSSSEEEIKLEESTKPGNYHKKDKIPEMEKFVLPKENNLENPSY